MELLMEHKREREQARVQHLHGLVQQQERRDALEVQIKERHDEELRNILEERARHRKRDDLKMTRLQRTQVVVVGSDNLCVT